MSPDSAFHMQAGAALLLLVLSGLLVALQLDRCDPYKRRIAQASIAIFLVGATAIWYLEEIKAMLWEDPPLAQFARAAAREAAEDAVTGARSGGGGGGVSALTEEKSGADLASTPSRIQKNRFQDCFNCPEMVIIPAGSDGAPIASFALGRFEVTVQEFHAFAAKAGATVGRQCDGVDRQTDAPRRPGDLQMSLKDAGSRPAACLTWGDAQAYVGWMSAKTGQPYRLSTAREWLYAARGAAAMSGVQDAARIQRASFAVGALDGANLAIGSAPGKGFGVFDMAGNVSEWAGERQAMGGSWVDGESLVRMRKLDAATATTTIGMRVVRDLPRH